MGGAVLNGISAPNGVTVLIALLSTSVYFGRAEVTPNGLPDRTSKEPADPCKAGECSDAALTSISDGFYRLVGPTLRFPYMLIESILFLV